MKKLLLPFLICLMAFANNLQSAESKTRIAAFDLFNFSLSSLDQTLGKRAQALGMALTKTFPKIFSKEKFKENVYSGVCFKTGSDLIKLAWYDSETEGFRFSLEKLIGIKTCDSPFSEGITFKTRSLDPKYFFPISHSHPSLELGVSTPAQVKTEMGAPDYSNEAKLIYVLKRDKDKETGCGADPKNGDFYAIEVIFDFKEGKLAGVWLNNMIAGEC